MFLKLTVLLAIIAGVWFGFRAIARRNKAKQAEAERGERNRSEEMIACSVCGTFVPDSQRNCGRDACPYPGQT